MRLLGDDIYIQQGEDFSLDFEITNENGDPYMFLNKWRNPYLVITVSNALYKQNSDFRQTYWLDMSQRYEEQSDGTVVLKPMKRFINTEALFLPGVKTPEEFSINEVLSYYGVRTGGQITLDPASDFDITNYLFYMADENDNRTYKYVESYDCIYEDTDNDGYNDFNNVVWKEYNCRIIKHFDTKKWSEQQYYYDIKILTGDTIEEYVRHILTNTTPVQCPELPWSNKQLVNFIEDIPYEDYRVLVREIYESGAPLMPPYDTKSLILRPTKIFVGVDLQRG